MNKSNIIYDVIIIGAGASGCAAAISCAEHGRSVLLLEKNSKIGRKLLVTGNGRCNFTNSNMNASCYFGDESMISRSLNAFSYEDTVSFFHKIGISSYERDGYYYPVTNQAKSVVNALEAMLLQLNVKVKCNQNLIQSYKEDDLFYVITDSDYAYVGKHLIFATGLIASDGSGLDDSSFSLIQSFGHTFTNLYPALVGVKCSGHNFGNLHGLRIKGEISLLIDGESIASEVGEIQFTEYGISGIPVFQLSSRANRFFSEGKSVRFMIRFLPDMSGEELKEELDFRISKFKDPLNGLLPDKLADLIYTECSEPKDKNQFLDKLYGHITAFDVTMIACRDYTSAQVCAGGIQSNELKDNLESKLIPGLYFAGELLNIDGICGGYNLQNAWSTGFTVGRELS